MIFASITHNIKKHPFQPLIQNLLSEDFLTIPLPNSFGELLIRLKATLSIAALNVVALLLPSESHRNPIHFTIGIVVLLLGGGLVEVLAGSLVAFASYLMAYIGANVLTASVAFAFHTHVGITGSLGILGCVGALAYMSKFPRVIAGIVIAVSIVGCFLGGSAVELNQIVAFSMGYLIARAAVY